MENLHREKSVAAEPDAQPARRLYPEGYLADQKNKETERIIAALATRDAELQ